ncbi:MAG: VCBS repeat-containing protein, partial [Candidatus Peribacteraceae bacterium]|nr:VCBS repeat-containing protein [Candidatus Peribacteraceae bacterium]
VDYSISWDNLVQSSHPLAKIDSITPNPADPDIEICLVGSGIDYDGTIKSYMWESDLDGEIATGDTVNFNIPSVFWTPDSKGEHKITLKVMDDDDKWSSETWTRLVVTNAEPVIVMDSPTDGDSYLLWETITFDASASSDDDGDSLTYSWDFGNGITDTGSVVTYSYPLVGTYDVTLTVSDGFGGVSTDNLQLTIYEPSYAWTDHIDMSYYTDGLLSYNWQRTADCEAGEWGAVWYSNDASDPLDVVGTWTLLGKYDDSSTEDVWTPDSFQIPGGSDSFSLLFSSNIKETSIGKYCFKDIMIIDDDMSYTYMNDDNTITLIESEITQQVSGSTGVSITTDETTRYGTVTQGEHSFTHISDDTREIISESDDEIFTLWQSDFENGDLSEWDYYSDETSWTVVEYMFNTPDGGTMIPQGNYGAYLDNSVDSYLAIQMEGMAMYSDAGLYTVYISYFYDLCDLENNEYIYMGIGLSSPDSVDTILWSKSADDDGIMSVDLISPSNHATTIIPDNILSNGNFWIIFYSNTWTESMSDKDGFGLDNVEIYVEPVIQADGVRKLEHVWELPGPTGYDAEGILSFEGSIAGEGDDFSFFISTTNTGIVGDAGWIPMFDISDTAGVEMVITSSESFSRADGQPVYVGVIDSDRTNSDITITDLIIDTLWIDWTGDNNNYQDELEHIWVFELDDIGREYTLNMEGTTSIDTTTEEFVISYSIDGNIYYELKRITADGTDYVVNKVLSQLGESYVGKVYIKIEDSDRTWQTTSSPAEITIDLMEIAYIKGRSSLENTWTFNVDPATIGSFSYFEVIGSHDDIDTDIDDFIFMFSDNGDFTGEEVPMFTITDISTNGIYCFLPPEISSTMYVRVIDSDDSYYPTAGATTLYIDSIRFINLNSLDFSDDFDGWITFADSGLWAGIATDGDYLKIEDMSNTDSATASREIISPSRDNYMISFDYYHYSSGPTPTMFNMFKAQNADGNNRLTIVHESDKLYVNGNTNPIVTLSVDYWHSFEIYFVSDNTYRILMDGRLIDSGTLLNTERVRTIGPLGDISGPGMAAACWDNFKIIETESVIIQILDDTDTIVDGWTEPLTLDYQWIAPPGIVKLDAGIQYTLKITGGSGTEWLIDKYMISEEITMPAVVFNDPSTPIDLSEIDSNMELTGSGDSYEALFELLIPFDKDAPSYLSELMFKVTAVGVIDTPIFYIGEDYNINEELGDWWYFNYAEANYVFRDGVTSQTSNFGLVVSRYVTQQMLYNPNSVIIIGSDSYIRVPIHVYAKSGGTITVSDIEYTFDLLVSDPLDADTDGDGLTDGEELHNYWTVPLAIDSDGDGLLDSVEVMPGVGTDPWDPDTEHDLIIDGDGGELGVIFRTNAGGFDGTFGASGPVWIPDGEGTGVALNFDVGDTIDIPSATALEITDAITLEAWINIDTIQDGDIICKDGSYKLYINSGNLEAAIHDGSSTWTILVTAVSATLTLLAGSWYHVVFTYDKEEDKAALYVTNVDGDNSITEKFYGTGTAAIPANSNNLVIGNGFDGIIDEVRILCRAITLDEALEDYQAGRNYPIRTNTTAWYRFNENEGNTVYDKAVNQSDLNYGPGTWVGLPDLEWFADIDLDGDGIDEGGYVPTDMSNRLNTYSFNGDYSEIPNSVQQTSLSSYTSLTSSINLAQEFVPVYDSIHSIELEVDFKPSYSIESLFGTSADFTRSVAWGDYDHNGYLDLAVGNNGQNYLYQNNGDGTFAEIAAFGAGNTISVAWGDYDHNGYLDLAVGNNGQNYLYQNNGDETFTPIAAFGAGDTTSVAWGDYDHNGYLDLAIGNFGQQNYLYQNNGDKTFTPIVAFGAGDTTSVAWGDYDHNGYLDLAIGNFGQQNYLYQNNGDETFTPNVAFGSGLTESIAWGDYDNNGYIDLAIGNQGQNYLYQNNGDETFSPNAAFGAGDTTSVAWGDYDHNGYLDLAIGNYLNQNYLYQNNGDGTFLEIAASNIWTGDVAWSDYDNDGDLDLAIGGYGMVNKLANFQNADIFVEIRKDNSGEPGMSASELIISATAKMSGGLLLIDFLSNELIPGEHYWIVSSISGNYNSFGWGFKDDESVYSDGIAMSSINAGASWTQLSGDFNFKIISPRPIAYQTPDGKQMYYEGSNLYIKEDSVFHQYVPQTIQNADVSARVIKSYALNGQEVYRNTARTADADGDGLIDGLESAFGCSSRDRDSDDDGLADGYEIFVLGTDPGNVDTDGDGVQDGTEMGVTLDDVMSSYWNTECNLLIKGTDMSVFVWDRDPTKVSDPTQKDSDNDGLWDGWDGTKGEDKLTISAKRTYWSELDPLPLWADGLVAPSDYGESDPELSDTDGDRVRDGSDATKRDCDGDEDGLWDGPTVGQYIGERVYGTQAGNSDSDGDGLWDGLEVGLDDTKIKTGNEFTDRGYWISFTNANFKGDTDDSTQTCPTNWDTDGDYLSDGNLIPSGTPMDYGSSMDDYGEDFNANGKFDEGHIYEIKKSDDSDYYIAGEGPECDPNNPDMDGDGIPDGREFDPVGYFVNKEGLVYESVNNDYIVNAWDTDSDNDGLLDGYEVNVLDGGNGFADADGDGQANMIDNDADHDGIFDGDEVNNYRTNSRNNDTDHDGLLDGVEVGIPGWDADNGVTTTNPLAIDTDGDGLPDG